MLEDLKQLSEAFSQIFNLISVLFIGYSILMGLAYRKGRVTWLTKEKKRCKSLGLPTISLMSKNSNVDFPWKDPSLIQGGLTGIMVVIILLGYVIFMLGWDIISTGKTINKDLFKGISILMTYPVSMIAFFIAASVWALQSKISKGQFWGLLIFIVIGAIASWIIPWAVASKGAALTIQVTILVILSFCLSYTIGMGKGLNEADHETQFPLVEVITLQGDTLDQLRLFERTDTDYRFIGEDGVNHIIPNGVIKEIRHFSL